MKNRLFLVGVAVIGAALMTGSGCREQIVETAYGAKDDWTARASVNGVRGLEEFMRDAGMSVSRLRELTPAIERYDVLVWCPDDFWPPSTTQTLLMEAWLSRRPRTLIYVGRDFDAAPGYWEYVARAGASEHAREAWRLRAEAVARHDHRRSVAVGPLISRWFVAQSLAAPRQAMEVRSDAGWLNDIDPSTLDIHVGTRLERPTQMDLSNGPTLELENLLGDWGQDAVAELLQDVMEQFGQLPTRHEVLLDSDAGPLVFRIRDRGWGQSQILVVNNGSFLLNLPLVNDAHRQLVGKLLEEVPGRRAALLHTDIVDRAVMWAEGQAAGLSGFEMFGIWPLGVILLQALLLGMVACLVRFPLFGRPRDESPPALTEFGRHIVAVGRLIQRTGDSAFARRRWLDFQRSEEGGSSTRME